QGGEMRNLLLDVLLVRADEPRQRDVPVVDLELQSFAEQRFREDDDRAFAEVVGARLETEAEHTNLLLPGLHHLIEGALNLQLVARQNRLNQRQLDVELPGPVLQRA